MTTTCGGGQQQLAACMLVVLAAATLTLTLTTPAAAAAAYGRQASTPTAQFVQSICNTTVLVSYASAYCSDVLVEGQESYKGSHIKVVGAAISRMVKHLAATSSEMRAFMTSTPGATTEYSMEPCIAVGQEAVSDVGGDTGPPVVPAVAKLRALEAAGDDKIAQPDLDALTKWVDKLLVGVKRSCLIRDAIYLNPDSKDIPEDELPSLKFLNGDVVMCRDLVRNYKKFTPPPKAAG